MPDKDSNGNSTRTFKAGEFQGYVSAKLEGICKEMAEIKAECQALRSQITNNRLKIGGIGGTVALIVSLLTILVKELIAR